MPALKNSTYERMAQLMAGGKSAAAAYGELHPKTKYPERNVGRYLKMHPEIEVRVKEIVEHKVDTNAVVVTKAMEQAAVDKAYIIGNLKEVVERCMQSKPVFDAMGKQVYVETKDGRVAAEYGFDPRAATRALHLMGLEVGMFTQRVKFVRGPLDGLPAPVLQMMQQALDSMVNGRVIEHEPSAASPVAPSTPA